MFCLKVLSTAVIPTREDVLSKGVIYIAVIPTGANVLSKGFSYSCYPN